MAMTENIVLGKLYRVLTDVTNDVWDRLSFWKKATDVELNDGTTLEKNKPNAILQRSTAYAKGDIAYISDAPSWVMLRCTTAGTTAATIPTTYSTISSTGTIITDGTAKFAVYDKRPNGTLASNNYIIPTVKLVNALDGQLTANGKHFYFDYQNGKYGYNTDANRGSSTFVAF